MTCALDVHGTHMWNAYLSTAIVLIAQTKFGFDKGKIVSLTIRINFGKRQYNV